MKAPSKRQDSDIYEQIRKLAVAGSNTKDFYELENLFKAQISSSNSKHSSTILSKSSCNSSISDKDTPNKIEELFYKESHCKDVNFSYEEKENKVPSIKPIIVNKKTCAVHGNKQSSDVHHKPSSICKVHGPQTVKLVKETSDHTKKVLQVKQSPPAYRFPPKVATSSSPISLLDESAHQYLKPELMENESHNEDGNTFTCPEFLMNLILPTDEPETEDILAAVGVQSAKGNYFHIKILLNFYFKRIN